MPRKSKAQQDIINRKIIGLKGVGFNNKQATAIALRMYRDGELPRPRSKPKPPNRLRDKLRSTSRFNRERK